MSLVADLARPRPLPRSWAGTLEVRLAEDDEDIAAAQALRYEVFHREMGAHASSTVHRLRRDIDPFDALCDHLLVIDHGAITPRVVGTYRLLRQDVAAAHGGFYSAGEYDLAPLIAAARPGRQLLELGRSCVAPEWRTSATIQLLWRGIATYLAEHGVGYLFGCASFPGADPAQHRAALAYLHHHHLAPPPLRARALPQHHVAMDMIDPAGVDARAVARSLPPLLKAYLRVGACVGDGAFVDHAFNTVDVLVVMPVDRITSRYAARFGAAND
ncbi:MAG: hypothetical protein RIS17_402 [Pseudomonadota bacterium]|jgi:putative hemolysin